MRELRMTRRRVALLTGLADIAGHWPLDRITQALSDFADGALSATISHLLLQAADAGEIILADPYFPEDQCGYVALAMGKHGGRELNYSSDIDLIIIYEPAQISYRGGRSHQQFVGRLTRHLIAILQEMTVDVEQDVPAWAFGHHVPGPDLLEHGLRRGQGGTLLSAALSQRRSSFWRRR